MKQKLLLSGVLFLACFVFACKKYYNDTTEEQTKTSSFLKEAKDYFYSQQPISSNGQETQTTKSSEDKYSVLWQRSFQSSTKILDFIEVPATKPRTKVYLYNFYNSASDPQTDLSRINSSLKRLLIYKTKGGSFNDVLLTYTPEYEYLKNRNFYVNDIQINQLKDYSGYIQYSTREGAIKFILYVKDGKIIRKIRQGKKSDVENGKLAILGSDKLKTNYFLEFCTEWYYWGCWTEGDPPVEYCSEPQIGGYDCTTIWIDDPVDPPGDGGDDGCLDLCGGGYTPDPPQPQENTPNDDCQQGRYLTAKSYNATISSQNAAIQSQTHSTGKEYGTNQRLTNWDGTGYPINTTVSTNNAGGKWQTGFTWNATDGYTVGFSHGHPMNSGPSPEDVWNLLYPTNSTELRNASTAEQNFYKLNASVTTTTINGNYIVTVKDWSALLNLWNSSYSNTNQASAFEQSYQTFAADYVSSHPFATPGEASVYALQQLFPNMLNIYHAPYGSNDYKPQEEDSYGTIQDKNC